MKRRFQIFVSSTFSDLQDERQKVLESILQMNNFPAGMELFPSANATPWDLIKKVIDNSDYYVLIIAGRYGSIDVDGLSYTEKEYDHAIATGKYVLPFLHKEPKNIPAGLSEMEPNAAAKLDAFRKKVEAAHHAKYWSNAAELASQVILGLTSAIDEQPAIGWVRADGVDNADLLAKVEQLREQIDELRDENAQLEFENTQLTAITDDGQLQAQSPLEIASDLPPNLVRAFLLITNVENHTHMLFQHMQTGSREGAELFEDCQALLRAELVTDSGEHNTIIPTSLGWKVLDELRKREIIRYFFGTGNASANPKAISERLRIFDNEMTKLLESMSESGLVEPALDARENFKLSEQGVACGNELFPTDAGERVFPPQ